MIYYLTHYDQKTFPFLIEYLKNEGNDVYWMHPPIKHGEYINSLIGAWNAVRKVHKGDTIITYMSSAGVLVWWISWLLHKKIHVIATNLALKNDNSLQTQLMALLYRGALKSKRFTLTVTSEKYGKRMQKKLHAQHPLPLLYDYGQYPGYAYDYKDNGKRIFCGGNTQRDWNSCIALAKKMPDWHFALIGISKNSLISDFKIQEIPRNIKVIEKLPFKQFIQGIHESTMVYIPVRWNCPAGLIVMMESAWEGKLIITSSNDITDEYVTDDRGLACNDIEKIAQYIETMYAQPEVCKKKVKAMQTYLLDKCSANAYSKTIADLISVK